MLLRELCREYLALIKFILGTKLRTQKVNAP